MNCNSSQDGSPHWAVCYIGLPWSAHGRGPDIFNCWEFVRIIQDRHFGRAQPVIANPEDTLAMGRTFRDHPGRYGFIARLCSSALPCWPTTSLSRWSA